MASVRSSGGGAAWLSAAPAPVRRMLRKLSSSLLRRSAERPRRSAVRFGYDMDSYAHGQSAWCGSVWPEPYLQSAQPKSIPLKKKKKKTTLTELGAYPALPTLAHTRSHTSGGGGSAFPGRRGSTSALLRAPATASSAPLPRQLIWSSGAPALWPTSHGGLRRRRGAHRSRSSSSDGATAAPAALPGFLLPRPRGFPLPSPAPGFPLPRGLACAARLPSPSPALRGFPLPCLRPASLSLACAGRAAAPAALPLARLARLPSPSPAALPLARQYGWKQEREKIAQKDLKSYFSQGLSGPSTHASGVGHVQENNQNNVEELAHTQEENDEEVNGQEAATQEVVYPCITEFHPDHIISDPGLRIPIDHFAPNIRDEVRRAFIGKGPTQPRGHKFPQSCDKRSFQTHWFRKYNWLEYSLQKNKAYCLYCYLFKHDRVNDPFFHDAFTKSGFSQWKNVYLAFPKHVGGPNSMHNVAAAAFHDFDNQRSSVRHKVSNYSKDALLKYETRLEASLSIVSYLALQGEPSRGHDETATSLNKGNFLEFLDWYKERNEKVKQAFDELCPKNAKMTSGTIQKELASCGAEAVIKAIKEEMGDCLFSVLVDESRDISVKEQMAIVVRYVNKKGEVVERFMGIKHVKDTTSESLKKALVEMLSGYGLAISKLRGQGYDGASNMRGEFNGLQKLIRNENPYAFYMHCFAHQLQLVIVAVSKCCSSLEDFFVDVTSIVSSTTTSCKRKDLLLDKHRLNLLSKLESGEISSGRGKQQATSLARPGDTRWGSHYKTLLRIESMWDSVLEVLQIVHQDERNPSRAGGLVGHMECFSFVFIMKMMLQILRITNELSLLLQRKDQNVVQAMSLVVDVRTRLTNLRDEGWEPLLEEAKAFCLTNDIPIPNMSDPITRFGRSRKGGKYNITQEHYYRIDTFYAAIDSITTELDHRFNELSSKLLVCFSCLDPRNSFSKFDVDKLARITDIYSDDFSFNDRMAIKDQLRTFIIHMRRVDEFKACYDLASLAKTMVLHERHIMFPLVYRIIELALLLPVATATVERAFSAMKIIKTELRNKMTDGWLNDLMIIYIEREIYKGLDLQQIKKAFQSKKNRQMQLPRSPKPRHN